MRPSASSTTISNTLSPGRPPPPRRRPWRGARPACAGPTRERRWPPRAICCPALREDAAGPSWFWATALAGLVDIGYVKATGKSVKIYLPKTVSLPEVEFEWKIPKWSNAIERDRARSYFQAYCAAAALHFVDKALAELQAGRTQTLKSVRGVLSHHVVIRKGKIANYHPYPPTPWNAPSEPTLSIFAAA